MTDQLFLLELRLLREEMTIYIYYLHLIKKINAQHALTFKTLLRTLVSSCA